MLLPTSSSKRALFLLLFLTGFFLRCTPPAPQQSEFVYTVSGNISPAEMGFTLTHEHLMSNFGGEANYDPGYDRAALLAQVLPYLRQVKASGVKTIVDCTTAYFGRDVKLMRELADSTGLNLVTNTGYYGAAKDRYVPEFALEASAEEIAAKWIAEFEEGIDGTGIRPGFIKLAFDDGPPSEIDQKLFEAGILAHQATGLTMAVHTGNNPAAAQLQLSLLAKAEVDPSGWIWTHANKMEDESLLFEAARQGAWISLDGVKAEQVETYVAQLSRFRKAQLLPRILLSHDGNSFPRGGPIRPYDAIQSELLPALTEAGFSEAELRMLTVENPAAAFQLFP